MKPRVLVVDAEELRAPLVSAIKELGCRVRGTATGEEAVRLLASFTPDILVTGIDLPGISGFALLDLVSGNDNRREIRAIVIASGASLEVLRKAYEKGAEDFLVRPFDPRELAARVETVLRRLHGRPASGSIQFGKLSLEPAARRAYLDGAEISFTKMEFAMLNLLVQKAGRVLTRDYLLQYLWGASASGATRTVDMHVANIRKKLGPAGSAIETVTGIGYLLSKKSL